MNIEALPESVESALEKWHSGKPVFTIDMGGMGPGYEQAIQNLVFAILEKYKDADSLPGWEVYRDEADKVAHSIYRGNGFSGAQVGAAKNLAWQFLKVGWREIAKLNPDLEDRWIQVNKGKPTLVTATK